MKTTTLIAAIAALGAAAGLAACADDYAYGPGPAYADVGYTVWYDGYYGPFAGGYWGPRGSFYYWDHRHNDYRRDGGGHFRHDGARGFTPQQGRSPPAARQGGWPGLHRPGSGRPGG
jgi:hypothetical protein